MKRSSQLMISVAVFVALVATEAGTAYAREGIAAQGQSGYWAQVSARDATVRDRPGGTVLRTLTGGQWFHVYPSYKNPSWYLGYVCPNGNRGCSNRQGIPGFILRSAISGRAAIDPPTRPDLVGETFTVPVMADIYNSSLTGGAHSVRTLYRTAGVVTSVAMVPFFPGQDRRVCAREVWMRNDKLWPIELLRAGDRFTVERYTDGSKNDGNARWAIGTARNLRGRVLVSALCR